MARKGGTHEQRFGVRGEYITLGQLLKAVGMAGTGGEAKVMLAEGGIRVNGGPEDRRGRKLRPGDVVTLPGGVTVRLEAAVD